MSHRSFTMLGRSLFMLPNILTNGSTKYLGMHVNQIPHRTKYITSGIQGIRNRKFPKQSSEIDDEEKTEETDFESDTNYNALVTDTMHVTRNIEVEQHVFVVQPFIKWGPKKSTTSPSLKLQEAEALISSLPTWIIEHSMTVSLESLDKNSLFGTGKLAELKQIMTQIRRDGRMITCLFISKGTLTNTQKQILQQYFNVPVMDRYSIVIQILRLHATSKEAKLQVAKAEIPYIWAQLKDKDSQGIAFRKTNIALSDSQKQLLRQREQKIKMELEKVRDHRELLRKKRKQQDFPIVAIVGYTNAGKTSLIKALTDEQSLQPRDQLFATLDVTAHAGLLPCKLEVIYMDTVGFMVDIPTGLIECFIATLEDAMLADIVIHVQDVSHENYREQCLHVEKTLQSLIANRLNYIKNDKVTKNNDHMNQNLLENIINVGNKSDLLTAEDFERFDSNLHLISSKTLSGIAELLNEIERKILSVTERKRMTIRIRMGGTESAWLYKNTAVCSTEADPHNSEFILFNVVISLAKLQQFKHHFIKPGSP